MGHGLGLRSVELSGEPGSFTGECLESAPDLRHPLILVEIKEALHLVLDVSELAPDLLDTGSKLDVPRPARCLEMLHGPVERFRAPEGACYRLPHDRLRDRR